MNFLLNVKSNIMLKLIYMHSGYCNSVGDGVSYYVECCCLRLGFWC
jgi:hypothetical protein